ncbi:hypothetical protein CAEBREN_16209 [Caenorhabditis brenneri]|uniref:Uncharacterized protein n=1 Tax=Caenorhabditis brenneri TaxID=135651 RepID=G0MLJ9_CAEBE|nr:hypothetical protein CAEBREN_16209 [Caenorhabditis brenneri]
MNLRKTQSTSKLEPVMDDTLMSINSESSVTSAESGPSSLVSNIARNSMLRTFVNRDSCTPVPPPDGPDTFDMPSAGGLKQESLNKMEDSLSISSHMSIDTIGSSHGIEEDSMSIGSASAYCTPSRNPLQRTSLRTSTRSVPGFRADSDDELQPALFRSLCNSAVRRPNNKAEFAAPMRRSMRMSIQKRNVSSMNMADVPEEEEAAPVANSSMRVVSEPIQEEEEEQFGAAKDFFDKNITSHDESADEGTSSISRLSTTSESRASAAGFSIVSDFEKGRKSSFFRKVFSGKSEGGGGKERRMSDVFHGLESSASKDRRSSMVSFTNDCSFTGGGVGATSNSNVSVSSIASSDSAKKPKMRKKAPSTSNLTQRLSSVFRRSSSSTVKDDDLFGGLSTTTTTSSRRNTLTGYSSISSGIGSIASAASDQGYGTIGSRNGQSISRSGSKRDDEMKRERTRRMIDRIIISDVPASELLKMKAEQMRKHDEKEIDGTREKETESSFLDFDVVAVDLKPDGTPFSTTAATFVDESLGRLVKEEIRSNYRPDRCGSITDHHPELVFVIPEPSQPNIGGKLNDSISSNDVTSDLLRNVRSGLHKAIEEWKKITSDRNASTMLIYPMFCQSEDEWDSKATIDSMFMMLDSILMNAKRWKPNGKCILAGITASNVQLLQEKYEDLRQSVATTATSTDSVDGALSVSTYDDLDTQSITSNSTMFGAKMM